VTLRGRLTRAERRVPEPEHAIELPEEERICRISALLDLYERRRDGMSEMDWRRAEGLLYLFKRALVDVPPEERERVAQLLKVPVERLI
jgi:hypothetical protein